MSAHDLITINGRWGFDYTYFAGEAATRFFRELVENRRIMGSRCPACKRLLVPARSFCDACMERTTEWKEVGPEGTLETFTIITTAFPGLPAPPIVMAYVTLDGADTALINLVHGEDLSDIDRAAARLNALPRVKVKFVDEPKGRITDFSFELLKDVA
ncbi:Zn-ribbon domain-containing OB-fold protein [Ramlibacter sp.]|uniref:Zn-ribbon domain-containing OB-fold protein n=1 Tax=Ramlibacter sp. TaxID=1917967 RepID=UPI003D1065F7